MTDLHALMRRKSYLISEIDVARKCGEPADVDACRKAAQIEVQIADLLEKDGRDPAINLASAASLCVAAGDFDEASGLLDRVKALPNTSALVEEVETYLARSRA